eukprot:m.159886 g.159886  ORF g.159886 m.159886 type:complete len:126 (-) comp13378_c0_seq5:133-510(-)
MNANVFVSVVRSEMKRALEQMHTDHFFEKDTDAVLPQRIAHTFSLLCGHGDAICVLVQEINENTNTHDEQTAIMAFQLLNHTLIEGFHSIRSEKMRLLLRSLVHATRDNVLVFVCGNMFEEYVEH